MILTIPNKKEHNVQLIAVASEKMEHPASDYKQIQDGESMYNILDYYAFSKAEPFPYGLLLLATGADNVDEFTIWYAYKKSEYLYFFIVKPVN